MNDHEINTHNAVQFQEFWILFEETNWIWRNDEDREINHHGRPVEVGEAESRPESSAKVPSRYFSPSNTSITLLYKWIDDDDQNQEPMIHTKIIEMGN